MQITARWDRMVLSANLYLNPNSVKALVITNRTLYADQYGDAEVDMTFHVPTYSLFLPSPQPSARR
jgi:hypothetical protein